MARKSSGYGAACYYAGKLVGRCTPADAQGYEQLMKSCGGNAARVLQEYAYFSPELRGILEKVAAVQAKESRTAGIFQSPRLSPWGDVQTSDTLCPGVFMVSTASHGGTMVALDMAAILSPAARKCGLKMGDYLCFEEDCDENIVLRELLDKKLWQIPDRIRGPEPPLRKTSTAPCGNTTRNTGARGSRGWNGSMPDPALPGARNADTLRAMLARSQEGGISFWPM